MADLMHPTYPDGATTDELIAWYQACPTGVPAVELEAAIPKAIDAVYAARDDGRMMHAAGAAAAVAALMAAHDSRAAEQHGRR